MEKITFKNSRDLKIVGNLFGINSSTLIIMAHGFTNNKTSDNRFDSPSEFLNSSELI